jgi:hypothetical protein
MAAPLLALGLVGVAQAAEATFPFDHELRLDTAPKRGSKRIPVLQVTESGNIDIDLWCTSGKGQVVFADNTIAIMPTAMRNNQCSDDQLREDEGLLSDLTDMKTWRRQGDVVTLTGSKTLRFRVSTN